MGASLREVLRRADAVQQRHASLAFSWAVLKKFGDDKAGNLAALVAYYGFFSLFPLLLVLVTVLGYLLSGDDALQQRILDSTLTQFPVIGDQIETSIGSLDGNAFALAVGIVGALWAGLGAIQAMGNAMNSVWNVPREGRPNFLVARLRGLLMLGVFGVGVIGTTLLGASGTFREDFGVLTAGLTAVAAFALAIGVFLLAFRVLPSRQLSWSTVLPGAVVAATGFLTLQLLGGFYVGRTIRGASETYGFFAVVIGLLSWMYLQAQIALIGAEVNVVRASHLWPRSLTGAMPTDADARAGSAPVLAQ